MRKNKFIAIGILTLGLALAGCNGAESAGETSGANETTGAPGETSRAGENTDAPGEENGAGKNSDASGEENGARKNTDAPGEENGTDKNSDALGEENEEDENSDGPEGTGGTVESAEKSSTKQAMGSSSNEPYVATEGSVELEKSQKSSASGSEIRGTIASMDGYKITIDGLGATTNADGFFSGGGNTSNMKNLELEYTDNTKFLVSTTSEDGQSSAPVEGSSSDLELDALLIVKGELKDDVLIASEIEIVKEK